MKKWICWILVLTMAMTVSITLAGCSKKGLAESVIKSSSEKKKGEQEEIVASAVDLAFECSYEHFVDDPDRPSEEGLCTFDGTIYLDRVEEGEKYWYWTSPPGYGPTLRFHLEGDITMPDGTVHHYTDGYVDADIESQYPEVAKKDPQGRLLQRSCYEYALLALALTNSYELTGLGMDMYFYPNADSSDENISCIPVDREMAKIQEALLAKYLEVTGYDRRERIAYLEGTLSPEAIEEFSQAK